MTAWAVCGGRYVELVLARECSERQNSDPRWQLPSCLGPGAGFCWLRVRYLETISSSRPSDKQDISGKAVLLFLSRFKKSGIEHVILARSSLLTLSRAQSRYGSGLVSSWRRAARNFSTELDFLHPNSQNSLALTRGISRF